MSKKGTRICSPQKAGGAAGPRLQEGSCWGGGGQLSLCHSSQPSVPTHPGAENNSHGKSQSCTEGPLWHLIVREVLPPKLTPRKGTCLGRFDPFQEDSSHIARDLESLEDPSPTPCFFLPTGACELPAAHHPGAAAVQPGTRCSERLP